MRSLNVAPLLSLILLIPCAPAQTGTITTVAGNGTYGSGGVGGPAVNAQITGSGGLVLDSADNIYFADGANHRVVRVDAASGILTVVAGNGSAGSSGDGGPASQASLNNPRGVALDAAGNLYISEYVGNRVRRVDTATGFITTIAGTGGAGFNGDGGPAVSATLFLPFAVALDAAGNLFIADAGNARIRRVDAATGIITTVAGNGSNGISADGVPAISASLSPPFGVSVDRNRNVLIPEYGSYRIRRVDTSTGILGTLAGNGGAGFTGDGVAATAAGLGRLAGNVATDAAGNYYFPDGTGRVRRVNAATGTIVTVAGNGSGAEGMLASGGGGGGGGCSTNYLGDGGAATNATLDGPYAVALTSNGNLVVSDWIDCRIRRVALPSPYPYTTTALSASAATVQQGQPVTFTATVSPISAGGVPTGTVYFFDQPQFLGVTPLGSAPMNGGSASYTTSSLAVNQPHQIVAYYFGDSSFNGSGSPGVPVTVTPALATPTVALTSSQNPANVNVAVAFTVTVAPPSGVSTTPTGTVQLFDGYTMLASASLSGGTAQFPASFSIPGAHAMSAHYLGDSNFAAASSATLTETVTSPTTITLTSNSASIVYGQLVTFTATVTPSGATGNVNLSDGESFAAVGGLNNGVLVLTTSNIWAGNHSIVATYAGDGTYLSSTSTPLAQNVAQAMPVVTVSSGANPSPEGQYVTLTATVSPMSRGATVGFFDGQSLLGSATLQGDPVSFNAWLGQGHHSITAVCDGDRNLLSGSSAAIDQVITFTPNLGLQVSPASPVYGQAVTLTAIAGNPNATGTVQFSDGGTPLGTVALVPAGASLTLSTLTGGTHSITASYNGSTDGVYLPATASASLTVAKAATTATVSSSLNPSTAGQAVTFTGTVSSASATGTIQFLDGATVLGTATISGGSASFSTTALSAGSHTIIASYSGDGNYTGSSANVTQVVKATTTTGLAADNTSVSYGQAVQLTATVTPSAATGTVQFLDGATVLGSVTLSGGSAAYSISTPAVGSHSFTAIYSGDAADAGSTSAAVAVTVAKANTSAGLTSSLNPSTAGQAVTFTGTVSPASATGTIQFLDGGTVLGTATISGGSASFSTTALSAGSRTITASYSGAANYNAASASLTQIVKAVSATSLAANNTSVTVGQSVTLTATVSPSPATGTVQFLDGATSLGAAAVSSGAAALSVSTLAVGSHSLTAVYSGDAADAGSTSAAVVVTVSKANTNTLITSNHASIVAGQTVQFTATVSPTSATGSVQFKDGSIVIGTANLSGGSASFSTSTLAAGSHSMTAVYAGDANNIGSTSAVSTQTVTPAPPSPPSSLVAAAASSSQINLTWTASPTSGVTYSVYASATSGFTPSTSNRIASGLSGTTYSNTGLSPSTTRYYLVTAVNANGESTPSNQASATTTTSGVSCHVVYTVTTQWNVGFGTAITIKNTGTTAINGWTLSWSWAGNQQITQAWNSNYTQNGANAALTNASWNPTITPGQTLSGMGFNASYSGSNPAPATFYVNGTRCE